MYNISVLYACPVPTKVRREHQDFKSSCECWESNLGHYKSNDCSPAQKGYFDMKKWARSGLAADRATFRFLCNTGLDPKNCSVRLEGVPVRVRPQQLTASEELLFIFKFRSTAFLK